MWLKFKGDEIEQHVNHTKIETHQEGIREGTVIQHVNQTRSETFAAEQHISFWFFQGIRFYLTGAVNVVTCKSEAAAATSFEEASYGWLSYGRLSSCINSSRENHMINLCVL